MPPEIHTTTLTSSPTLAIADTTHGGAHGGGEYLMPHEVPHLAMIVQAAVDKDYEIHGSHRPHPSHAFFINPMFSAFYAIILILVIRKALGKAQLYRPGRLQTTVELLLGGLRKFFGDLLGPGSDKHIPFFGTMWLFILINNLAVLVPLLKSPTSSFKMTIVLAVITMVYARWQNLREGGFLGYLYHLAGSPKGFVMWCIAPMMFAIEAVGEVTKTLSLGLRLFGSIMGEDKLLAVMLGLGMLIVATISHSPHPILGVPLQAIFIPMVLLMSTIQATILTLLGAIFMKLMMPHDHEHEEGHEAKHPAKPAAH